VLNKGNVSTVFSVSFSIFSDYSASPQLQIKSYGYDYLDSKEDTTKGDYHQMREFTVIIEQDEDGIYMASVPELLGCHTQAETLDELNRRIKEAIELYLEVEAEKGEEKHLDFIGIQRVKVEVQ
jgi:predicted RNase H-like HicB family nuclease